jgi:hypothetical protein
VEELTLDELAKGQDVFFGYFRTPQSSELPTGFYTVRIAQSATGEWLARFVDAKGNTVKEVPAIVGHGQPPPEGKKIQLTKVIDVIYGAQVQALTIKVRSSEGNWARYCRKHPDDPACKEEQR